MNFETSLLSSSELESSGSVKSNHAKDPELCTIANGNCAIDEDNMEEPENPREILRQFLERSLSQSAKSSLMHIKPEGYHHLKRDGKLAYYQRQQSKPEQGVLVRRESSNAAKAKQTVTQLQEISTKLSAKSEQKSTSSKDDFLSVVISQKEEAKQTLVSNSTIVSLQKESKKFQSTDSVSSDEDEVKYQRRKSFSKAILRKNIISFIESNKQKIDDNSCVSDEKPKRKSSIEESRSSRRKSSSAEDALHHDEDGGESTLEKKNSISGRLKKVMASSSNKKKAKYKKSIEIPQLDEYDVRGYSDKAPSEPPTAGADVVMGLEIGKSPEADHSASLDKEFSISVVRNSSSLKRKPLPSEESESSDSPPKNKSSFPPKIIVRSLSLRRSPKVKRSSKDPERISSSLNALNTSWDIGDSKGKTSSLPISMAHGVNRGKPERSLSVEPTNKVKLSRDKSRDRPRDLDLSGKKKSGSKVKRFFRSLLKRPTRSSQTNLSHSHPSLPIERRKDFPESAKTTEKKEKKVDGSDSVPNEQRKHFHHRGSNSFSPGDKLNTRKRREFQQFVETLDRVSSHYSRHMNSFSTPGSRGDTPESSFFSADYQNYVKGVRSGPPSRQSSNISTKFPSGLSASAGKSYRQFKDDEWPALAAFQNIRSLQNNLDQTRGVAPKKGIYRRHTHHTHFTAFSNRHERHRVVADSIPLLTEERGTTDDVTDGIPFIDDAQPRVSIKSSSSADDDVDMCDVVDSAVLIESHDEQTIKVFHDGNGNNLPPPPPPPDEESQWDRPCTSTMQEPSSPRNGYVMSNDDVEKLVREIAQCIRTHGDRLNTSVNTPDIEPIVRDHVMTYLSDQTYTGFHRLAQLLFQHLSETPSNRNPETLSIMVAFNMSRFLCNLFTRPDGGVVGNILKYSTNFVMDVLETTSTSLANLTAQLQATEEEISRCESTEESPSDTGYFYEVD